MAHTDLHASLVPDQIRTARRSAERNPPQSPASQLAEEEETGRMVGSNMEKKEGGAKQEEV